jgi:predicted neuraminidase
VRLSGKGLRPAGIALILMLALRPAVPAVGQSLSSVDLTPRLITKDLDVPGGINHGPGLAALEGGDLLACWYSGRSEAGPDVRLLCARAKDGGDRWAPPQVVVPAGDQAIGAATANKSVGNATLLAEADGRLWLIYGVIRRWDWPLVGNVCRNWFCGRVDAKTSTDGGRTWSPSRRLDDQTGALPRGRPLHVDGLGDVLPLYREGAANSFLRIVDLGQWFGDAGSSGQVVDFLGPGLIQPALVRQDDGLIRAYFRDTASRAVYTALFDPASGRTTPAIATDLPNPGAAVDVFRDPDGGLVLIYNPSTSDRETLALAWSDDGVHFRRGCDLVGRDELGEVAYPAVVAANGVWHVVFSAEDKTRIRHVRFNQAWLRLCRPGAEKMPFSSY